MKILNLYAGIGGNRKLWGGDIEVTAVELNPDIAKIYQDFFPDDKGGNRCTSIFIRAFSRI